VSLTATSTSSPGVSSVALYDAMIMSTKAGCDEVGCPDRDMNLQCVRLGSEEPEESVGLRGYADNEAALAKKTVLWVLRDVFSPQSALEALDGVCSMATTPTCVS